MVKHGEKNQVDLQGGSSQLYLWFTGAKRREFSGMIHFITSNNHPSNPQQPIHSLLNTSKLNTVKKTLPLVDDVMITGHQFPVIRN